MGAPAASAAPATSTVPAVETDLAAHGASSERAVPVAGHVPVSVAASTSPSEEALEGGVDIGFGAGGVAKVIYPMDGVEVEINGEAVRAKNLGVAGYFLFNHVTCHL